MLPKMGMTITTTTTTTLIITPCVSLQVEALGLERYPFVPLLTSEQYAKTKEKADLLMRGNRINPTFGLQPPALRWPASEMEIFPTGAVADNLGEH
jgi:hypothetical protein